ncbi:MAG: exodeoxyribonuclease III [Eubacteriales bacterium]|nr:exodeoxyribonuclease III [Eubacteriales bacterium]
MKIVSWNVNGLRACLNKGFLDYFSQSDADIFCIQETKMQQGDAEIDIGGYHDYWNDAERKGYAGTAVFSKAAPRDVAYGIGIDAHDHEGRVITLDFDSFYFVNAYVPNAGEELKRLGYRMEWDGDFRAYMKRLDEEKPVVVCGDFNVAHQEIDLKNPSANHQSAGFTDEEREGFTKLLEAGFVDVFRNLYPDARDMYTYWTYRFGARQRNAGWRIDYGCVSERIMRDVRGFAMHSGVMGSDHCPIELDIIRI